MLLKDIEVYVYKVDNDGTFEAIGQINRFTSLMWPDKFNGYSTFEMNMPVTPENKALVRKGHVIWCGGDNACIIEIIESNKDENGQKTYKIKGRTLEILLASRIIWGTYVCKSKNASTAMYEIVQTQCVTPRDNARKIPFLECAPDEQLGKVVTFQKTGDEVYDVLQNISMDSELGFDVLFKPREKKLIFKVTKGVDRTILSESGDASGLVIFSTDLDDIISSSYYTSDQDKKTIAYVAGEGEGATRKYLPVSTSETGFGFERKELYVDARDLQSEVQTQDEDGNEVIVTIPEAQYNIMLAERGIEKLAEYASVESFEAKMRVIGDIQYKYGVDYNKGDKVIIQDEDIGIQVIATITEVSQNYDDEYELVITFGHESPTLIQKIKRQIS